MRYRDLTKGSITKGLLLFALPMMAGNLLQQLYNIADTLIVGQVLGRDALAAVGSAYTLMVFLTSILLGLSMGAGAVFSIYRGRGDEEGLKSSIVHAFFLILAVALVLNVAAYLAMDAILRLLQIPPEIAPLMRGYLEVIFAGILATFLYNFLASLLRALGNSAVPLVFLAISAVLNVALDLLFVITFSRGVRGAAEATVIAQCVSGLGLLVYTVVRCKSLCPARRHFQFSRAMLREICSLSVLTCLQQSVMNFGILCVQGLVNSFGAVVMASFAAAVKIDSFAYMPVQDFGNAFSTFVAQNYGAGKSERIKKGFRLAIGLSTGFCLFVSAAVWIFAKPLMLLFVQPHEAEILAEGMRYLRVEGAFYVGIGLLFLLYGFFRAVLKPGMSLVLTVISLGLRVALAYLLAPVIGVVGIWLAIPIGWVIADVTGFLYYFVQRKKLL